PIEPWVRATRPKVNQVDVDPSTFIAADVRLPNVGRGIDDKTITDKSELLYRASDRKMVNGIRNTTGGGAAIVMQRTEVLDRHTKYTFEVTPDVKDAGGSSFKPYKIEFTTGDDRPMIDFAGGFE